MKNIPTICHFLFHTTFLHHVLQCRIHWPKLRNKILIYLLFQSWKNNSEFGFRKKSRIRPDPDPQHWNGGSAWRSLSCGVVWLGWCCVFSVVLSQKSGHVIITHSPTHVGPLPLLNKRTRKVTCLSSFSLSPYNFGATSLVRGGGCHWPVKLGVCGVCVWCVWCVCVVCVWCVCVVCVVCVCGVCGVGVCGVCVWCVCCVCVVCVCDVCVVCVLCMKDAGCATHTTLPASSPVDCFMSVVKHTCIAPPLKMTPCLTSLTSLLPPLWFGWWRKKEGGGSDCLKGSMYHGNGGEGITYVKLHFFFVMCHWTFPQQLNESVPLRFEFNTFSDAKFITETIWSVGWCFLKINQNVAAFKRHR